MTNGKTFVSPQRHRGTEKSKIFFSVFSLCLCVSVVKGLS